MMLDASVVGIIVAICVVIAFLKGIAYDKIKHSNKSSKYSDEDIQRFKDFIKDMEDCKKH